MWALTEAMQKRRVAAMALTEILKEAMSPEICVVGVSDAVRRRLMWSRSSCQTNRSRYVGFVDETLVNVLVDLSNVADDIALDSKVSEFGFGVEKGLEGSVRQLAASKEERGRISSCFIFLGR